MTLRKTFIIMLSMIGIISLAGLFGASAYAQDEGSFDPLAKTCAQAPESAICLEKAAKENENPLSGEDSTLMKITNLLALATSVIAVIVIVVAGITMSLSGGDSGKIQSSRNSIIYALVGLLVVALSRSIIFFVINRA